MTPFDQPHPIRGGFGDPRTVFKGADTEQTHPQRGRLVLLPSGSRHLCAGRLAGLCGRSPGRRPRTRWARHRRLRQWTVDAVLAHRSHRPSRPARGCRPHRARRRPAEARAHPPDASRGRSRSQPASAEPAHAVSRHDGAARAGDLDRSRADSLPRPWTCPPFPFRAGGMGSPITPALVDLANRVTRRARRNPSRSSHATSAGSSPRTTASGRRSPAARTQNWPVFDGRKQRGMTGRYLFRLTAEGSGGQTLRRGDYVIVVVASDSAGNRGVARRSLNVPADLERF